MSPSEFSNVQVCSGLFGGGVYDRKIVQSLHRLLVEVVHLRVGLSILLAGLTQASFLTAQDLL